MLFLLSYIFLCVIEDDPEDAETGMPSSLLAMLPPQPISQIIVTKKKSQGQTQNTEHKPTQAESPPPRPSTTDRAKRHKSNLKHKANIENGNTCEDSVGTNETDVSRSSEVHIAAVATAGLLASGEEERKALVW
jgi:hypothetical protein